MGGPAWMRAVPVTPEATSSSSRCRASRSGATPSRRRIFVRKPATPNDELDCAREILSTLMRRAYRRPVTDADLLGPLALYRQGRAEGDFDAGIEMALSCLLYTSPSPRD